MSQQDKNKGMQDARRGMPATSQQRRDMPPPQRRDYDWGFSQGKKQR